MLAQELDKPVIKKLKNKIKIYARFKENIWLADLPEVGPLFCKDRGVKYLLYAIDVSPNMLGLHL